MSDQDDRHPYGAPIKAPLVFSSDPADIEALRRLVERELILSRLADIRTEHDKTPEGSFRRLVENEPTLTEMAKARKSWAMVGEILRKVSTWVAALAGAFYVLRELLKAVVK